MTRSGWQYFPHYLGSVMLIVFAVNGYMMYDAFTTFPGTAGQDGFDLSNEYNRVIAAARQQAALGWHIDAGVTADSVPALTVTDRAGTPLAHAEIAATAERPVGPPSKTTLVFTPDGGGTFKADTALWAGQWDVMLTVKADGHVFGATRRVVVR
jgi:nitrogen fixation protein FixH